MPQTGVGEWEDRGGPGQQVAAESVHRIPELEDKPCHWLAHMVHLHSPSPGPAPPSERSVRDSGSCGVGGKQRPRSPHPEHPLPPLLPRAAMVGTHHGRPTGWGT